MSMQGRKLVHSDIKPENPPERAAHYLDVPNMPWEPTKFPGIRIKVLYTDGTGITTALFKLEPGAVVPLHEHTALEQTYVIEGSLERTMKANAGPVSSCGALPAISTRRLRPTARCCSASFSSPIALPMAKSSSLSRGSGRASLVSVGLKQASNSAPRSAWRSVDDQCAWRRPLPAL